MGQKIKYNETNHNCVRGEDHVVGLYWNVPNDSPSRTVCPTAILPPFDLSGLEHTNHGRPQFKNSHFIAPFDGIGLMQGHFGASCSKMVGLDRMVVQTDFSHDGRTDLDQRTLAARGVKIRNDPFVAGKEILHVVSRRVG